MTDKIQKIRETVENRYEYWKEKESNSHSIESEIRMSECKHLLLMLDSLQEEPVSEELEEAAHRCYRPNETFMDGFKKGAKWGKNQAMVEIQAQSMALAYGCPKEEPINEDFEKIVEEIAEPTILNAYGTKELARRLRNTICGTSVSEDLEKASKEWLIPQLDKSYAAFGETKQMELTHFDGYAMLDAIEFGAKWKEEQFEKNRLAHCDAQTEEETEIERDFVMSIIENEHRQPTFDDAIKYGMRLQRENMMKDAVKGLVYAQMSSGEVMFRSNYVKKEGFKFGDKVKLIVIKED